MPLGGIPWRANPGCHIILYSKDTDDNIFQTMASEESRFSFKEKANYLQTGSYSEGYTRTDMSLDLIAFAPPTP